MKRMLVITLSIVAFFTSVLLIELLYYALPIGDESTRNLLQNALEVILVVSIFTFLFGLIFLRSGHKDNGWYHGSARFATPKEIDEFCLRPGEKLPPGSSFISFGPKEKIIALPPAIAVQHGIVLGGTGTGKSRGYFLPNCAWANNTSIVCTDPKSELWTFTSGFHPSPRRYAPTEPEQSWPFNWIPLCRNARISELSARAIVESGSAHDTDRFWIDAETAFLSALFSHTSTLESPTPITAYRLFTRQEPEALLEQLKNSPSEAAREQAIIFEQTSPKIRGGIVPAVAAKLQFLRDESIAGFTSSSLISPDFSVLRQEPTAVYYCLRESDITRLRPLTSLFFTILLEQIAGSNIAEGVAGTPIVMMLDEFGNIGTIPDFATVISLARGRGISIWLGLQSLAQLNARYGRDNAQTIVSNCATKIALHGLDVQTAEYVSRMLGDTTVVAPRASYHEKAGLLFDTHTSTTYSTSEHRRPLMTPDEVMRLVGNEAILRTGNRYPMLLYKIYYNEAPRTAALAREQLCSALDGEPTPTPIQPSDSEEAWLKRR